jgi:small nuclear ribonucleoprotein (snRNP)-like protein
LSSSRPTLFHMLERLLGKRVLVVVERDFGYEGELVAISHHPPGLWLSEAEAIVLRSTVVNPIPQIVSKEKKQELFVHLNSVLRLEAASESGKTSERK